MRETKLSKQQKKALLIIGKKKEEGKCIYSRDLSHFLAKGKIPDHYIFNYSILSAVERASISRTLKRLVERGLVYKKTKGYIPQLKIYVKCCLWGLTEKGYQVYETVNKEASEVI